MGADYLFYVKTIETHARAFVKVIIFSIGSVHNLDKNWQNSELCTVKFDDMCQYQTGQYTFFYLFKRVK